MVFDKEYVLDTLKEILSIDSPSGFTKNATEEMEKMAKLMGYESYKTNKGNLIVPVKGKTDKNVAVIAHVDTLGLMVRSINHDGTLRFAVIGGPVIPTLDGEYCSIYTRDGKKYRGTILSNSPAGHVFLDAHSRIRNSENMHIRLDECVRNRNDVLKLGISPGDFICYDTKTEILENGFIKSRFLDDKLSVACIFGVMKYLKDNNIVPEYNVKFIFTVHEEIGHGGCFLPEEMSEVLAVDMGCIGLDLSCTELDVSICAKDTTNVYDYDINTRLVNLAKDNSIGYAVDVYPKYSSDVVAALKAGYDIKGALIGPGVSASHGMERSHYNAADNTMKLILLYLTN